MLIFVILSITEAYLSNPSQLQPQLHPCEHPRTLLCPRPPTPQHIVPPCSPPSLPPYPPPKPLFHLPLPPPIFHPFSPPRPAFCPPAPPCPPPSLPSSCPPTTAHPYPSPPAVTPPSNYELIHYSDGISESYQGMNASKYETKYPISNCSSNNSNCAIDDYTVPPENDCCTNCSASCRFRYVRKTSQKSDQVQEVDPVCNNELMKQIIDKQTDDDINKSKIRIERTLRWFLGQLFGVICGNGDFAYIIQTKDFCQHRKGNVTCYIFRPY